jgi:hypothetical protein
MYARSQHVRLPGDASVGAQLDLVFSAPDLELWELVPYLSESGFGVLDPAAVRGETHLELHLGLAYAARFLLVQLFALGYIGNDVGITRCSRRW